MLNKHFLLASFKNDKKILKGKVSELKMALTKNNFYSYITIALLSFVLISSTLFSFDFVSSQSSGTEVSGIIASETTWTKSNSPYILVGPTAIGNEITLTIEPGVIVYFGEYYLIVNGTLNARGTPTDKIFFICNSNTLFHEAPIQFTETSISYSETTGSGCIIQNAFLNSSFTVAPTILIVGASPKIDNCYVIGGYWSIIISGGSPVISNNYISSTTYGGGISSSASKNSDIQITENIILGCGTGVLLIGNTTFLTKNLIINNDIGLHIYEAGGCQIVNNTISQNEIGVSLNVSPISLGNNIENNLEYNLAIRESNNINFTYNWWGTTDIQTINQSINDYKNDFNLGVVNFIPFLDIPNHNAPIFTTSSADIGGSISPSGITKLNYGDDITFTIAADSGYHLVDVLVNGTSIGATGTCSIEDISGATEIIANFEIDPTPTPTPTPSPTPTVTPTPTLNPTPSPTPTASPSPTPTATVEPTPSPTPDSTPSLTPTPTDNQEDSGNFFFSPTFLIVLGVVVVVSAVIGGVLIWKKW
jgi:parallel beta-helix repeat protein